MKTTHHIYTNKRYVLNTIKSQLQDLGDFKYFDIFVIKSSNPSNNIFEMNGVINKPNSYEELVELLKDCDAVYSFDRVETNLHGAIAYDIVLNE